VAGRIAEISRFRAAAAGYGTRVTGANVTLVDAKVEIRGNQLVLRAIEDTVLSFEVDDRGPRPEDVTRQRVPHEFIFDPISGGWVLVFDRPAWPQSNGGGTPGPKLAQPLLADKRSNDSPGGMKVSAKPVGAWGTYQWLDAVYYAHTYAFSYNSAYIAYVQDCTNFMSQALRAGAWTLTSMSSSTDPNLWWYDDTYDQNSQTWSAADWLINFVYSSGRGYSLSAFTDLVLGDLMFADWAYNGTPGVPEHAMMLTYKTSNS
jgi:putative amidase-like protein